MNESRLELIEHAAKSAGKMERIFAHPVVADLLLIKLIAPRLVDADPSWGRKIRTSFLKMGGPTIPREAIPALKEAVTATRRMHETAARAHREKEPVVWFTWPVPAAVIAAFGVATFCPENIYSVANSTGGDGSTRMCEIADQHGIPQEVCTINRCMLGAFLAGHMPTPRLCVTANHPCDGNHAGNTILRELADCEHFSVGGSYDRSPESVAIWSRSIWELIAFLEDRLGRSLDWDLLRGYASNINRMNAALSRVTEMHREIPSPGLVNALAVFWRVASAAGWDPDAARGAELLLEAAQKISARNRSRKAPRERMRVILGDQGAAWTDLAPWLKREYGAVIVTDYLGHFSHHDIDLDSKQGIIEGLVLDRLFYSMSRQAHGTMEYTLDELDTALREYGADCVIFHSSTSCRHNQALRHELEDMCRAAGAPACFLDVDIIDRRVVSEAAIKQKLRAFFAANGLPR